MRIVVLGGAGAMGQVAVRDLAHSNGVNEVVIAELSRQRAESVCAAIGVSKVKIVEADINQAQTLVTAFSGADVVINSTPYQFNLKVMEAALQAGTNYIDLGGLFHVTRKQLELDERFRQRGLLAVLGMGAAPGMTNVMAAHACQSLERIEAIDMVVAGVDFAVSDHPFLPPYALDTILDEYALEPMVFEDGQFHSKPPMSGETTVEMPAPVGRVKAFLTLHSEIATLPLAYADKGIKRVTYKLGLPEQFHERARFLVELGFGSQEPVDVGGAPVHPRKMLAAMIAQHKVPDSEPNDCEVVRVDVRGQRNGAPALVRLESLVYSHPKWKVSCGALDTGVPPSIVAQMIASGIIKQTGVLPPEQCVPPEAFFAELAKRSIPMRQVTEEEISATRQPVEFHS
jgi:saccharopine dehydrogenase-like NADP-dependent oxidoreductase